MEGDVLKQALRNLKAELALQLQVVTLIKTSQRILKADSEIFLSEAIA